MNKMVAHPLAHAGFLNRVREHMKLCGYSPHTIKAYLGQVQGFIRFQRPVEMNQISEQEIRDYLNHLVESGLSRSTIDQAATAMEILWREMAEESLDLSGFKRPRKLRPNPVVLTPEEVNQIAVATENPKHRLMIEMAYYAGLRVSELVEVKVGHLNLERLMLYVPGLGRNSRTTVLSEHLTDALKRQIGAKDTDHYLFPSERGGRLTTRAVAKFFKKSLLASGVGKPATPHSLRQSFTNSMLHQGTDPVALQSILGRRTLSNLSPDSKRAA
ncbi:hypothetical protein UZ36_01460 [Candidatus Nitromaritima sp. SCGC AAA799-C22]|nr:hypothetical protein UZ36_01460 [Candidatus Nitromaritima sp. SCGC AAA799-C22]